MKLTLEDQSKIFFEIGWIKASTITADRHNADDILKHIIILESILKEASVREREGLIEIERLAGQKCP